MNQLSDRLNSLSPSATLAMSQKSAELKAQGIDVINLSVGEPDFNTPDHIKEAAKKAIDDNFSRYSPVPGYPALRNAIVEKLKKENGLEYTAAQISCANGAKQSVCNAILVLVNPGDEVIVPAPYWVSYPEMVKLAEGKPVIVTAGIEQDFKITPAQLEAAITPKTKALILCSPSNPTGSVYSKEELAGLVAVLAKYPQVVVIADEIYEHINYIGVGEPDFNTPDHIKEAAKKAIDDNFSRYSPVPGYPALRNAIVEKLKKENGLEYTAAQISCANGAKQSVCNAILVLVNPGDEVIVPAPYWVSYPEMVKLAEGKPVIVTAGIEQDFKITPAQLEAAITPKTKALILCSPSNPTGSVYSKEELAGLVAVLAKYPQVVVIADEIYEHINYIGKHQSIAQFPEMKDRTVIVNGVSKAYAMTGWRIGFIAGPEWLVKACNKLQGQYTSGPCSVSQKAAEAAYTGTQTPVEEMRKAFERRRDLIVKLAKEVPGFEVNVPEGAFYLFPKCSSFFGKSAGERKIDNSDDLAMYLLEVAHVACVGGTSFGAPECIRMSYATSDENIVEAIRRIKEALSQLA